MGNSVIDSRASSLEDDLGSKLKCYVKVGWAREPDGTSGYIVFIDVRVSYNAKDIPSSWYGDAVSVQEVYPPGVQPLDPLDGMMPW